MLRTVRRWLWPLMLLTGSGCLAQVRRDVDAAMDVDAAICAAADRAIDLETAERQPRGETAAPAKDDVFLASAVQAAVQDGNPPTQGKPPTLMDRLKLPAALPGAGVPDIQLPPPTAPRKEIEAAIDKYFPPLPKLPDEPRAAPGPAGQPLSLSDLQKLAAAHSPVLRQAAAEVQAALGAAVQAGLYPNPTVGYMADEIGTEGSAGKQGGFIGQTFKTAGKLRLARDAALQEVRIAEHKLRQTEAEVHTRVRAGYFDVLVAQRNLAVNRSLSQLTDEVYKVLVQQLKVGEVATYEPMQVRVLAMQARGMVVVAHNRYLAEWKKLASAMGVSGMPLTQLAGRVDIPIPRYQYDKLLAHVLSRHTEVLIAQEKSIKANTQLRLARVTPVPDLGVRVTMQTDTAAASHKFLTGVEVGVPMPLWDRNQGNIRMAQAQLLSANEEAHRVRADLTGRLALAFEKYETNRALLELSGKIIPNQVQAFRAVVARHSRGGPADKDGVSYNDLVTAEQALVGVITNYLNVLREQWAAVVEVAGLLQTDDLFQLSDGEQRMPVPDLEQLLPLCCQHPCSPVCDPRLFGGDGAWPPAFPPAPPAPASPPPAPVSVLPPIVE